MSSAPDTSLVIVLYGKRGVTEMCLDSLEEVLGPALGDEVELVLVDNASPDDTGELLDRWEDRATVVRLPENRNFSGGCNAGARAAAGRVLLFLNNDMEFVPGALEDVAAEALDPEVGIVGARLLFPDGTLQHAGVVFAPDGAGPPMPVHLFHHEAGDHAPACAVLDLDAVTGACMAIRRDLFLELGGFDEAYVNGLEDIDLCLRVRMRGLRVVYRGDRLLVHHESATRRHGGSPVAQNIAIFNSRWGAVLDADEAFARERLGARLSGQTAISAMPGDWHAGAAVSVEGRLSTLEPAAAEARALLAVLEHAGLAPSARDAAPTWVIPDLGHEEMALLARAAMRHRSPSALSVRVATTGRTPGCDVLRVGALHDVRGAATLWAATPALVDELIGQGFPPDRVAFVAPAVAAREPGPGGEGVVALLPAHDLAACDEALAALTRIEGGMSARVVPNVRTPSIERMVAQRLPGAELLGPVTSEEALAALAATADLVFCADPTDPFDRAALVAASAGAAVVTVRPGPAAAVLGAGAVSGDRAWRSAAIAAACAPGVLAAAVAVLLERARMAPAVQFASA